MNNRCLLNIEKPARYIGGEMGSIIKTQAKLRFVLAFPDVYEVGMSHLGLRILYDILNRIPDISAERAYAPWPDREAQIIASGDKLATLETSTPLDQTDIIGFTLQYELSYTNILNMLRLSGIPLESAERTDSHPIIVAGGPCAYNPEPISTFVDAFLLGDGEEAVAEIAETVLQGKEHGTSRDQIIRNLGRISGIYLPSSPQPVRRRFLPDLDSAAFPAGSIIPFMKTVHDRVAIEIARGCTRGCRFCQAGYLYRPLRERSPESILKIADEAIKATGYEELSLLSLSSGDYSCIEPLVREIMARYSDSRVALSLPSLRVGTLTDDLINEIKKVRKTGFTLAPEAGTERLRRVINKNISEDVLLETAFEAYKAGWRLIKLYFMIGLPTETREDVLAIADLARRVKDQAKRAGSQGDVNVSVGTFVPKAHTPFQWQKQITIEEIREHHDILRLELKKRRLNFKWQDPNLSFMEGVFARGDRKLAPVLKRAVELGCRFDGWREHFSMERWTAAFADSGIDPATYLLPRDIDSDLPWSLIDCGVSPSFLKKEYFNSIAETFTEDCRNGSCTSCGVCDFNEVKNRTVSCHPVKAVRTVPQNGDAGAKRIRMRFTKRDKIALLSHLELINLFTRAVSRADIPVLYTQGFHPHPRFSFANATGVGIESEAEYLDIFVSGVTNADAVMLNMNSVLPSGLKITDAAEIGYKSASLSATTAKTRYRIDFSGLLSDAELSMLCGKFMACTEVLMERPDKNRCLDLRKELFSISCSPPFAEITVGKGKPVEFARAISGISDLKMDCIGITKLEAIFEN